MSKALRSCAVVALCIAGTGCFIEASYAYHPYARQTNSRWSDPLDANSPVIITREHQSAWSAGLYFGFYIDVPIRAKHTSVGVGWSPGYFNRYQFEGSAGKVRSVGGNGSLLRLDGTLPSLLLSRHIEKRLTLEYNFLGDTNAISAGNWFAGATLGVRPELRAGKRLLAMFSAGVERITGDVYTGTRREQATESSTGIGFRLLISPPFGGTVRPGPYEGMGQTGGKSCTQTSRDGDYTRTTTTECTN